jgi:hypothetical protein
MGMSMMNDLQQPRLNLSVIGVIWFVLSALSIGQDAETKSSKFEFLDCTVVDADGLPMESVQVFDCPSYFELQDRTWVASSYLGDTDTSGRFRFERRTDNPMGLAAYLVAEGKVCDLLSSAMIGSRPLQVRMQNQSNFEVVVYDESKKPIRNAKVAPKGLYFPNSFWHAPLSNAVIEKLGTRTDELGRARLKGANAKHLESVQVDIEGKGSRTFLLPTYWDRESTIELVWTDFPGSLRCKVVDIEGVPVSNVRLLVRSPSEEVNSLVIKKPTIEYSTIIRTDGRGECLISDIPIDQVDVEYAYDDSSGIEFSAGPVSILPDSIATIELQFPVTRQVQFSVLDTSHFMEHPKIEVTFRKQTDTGFCFATGRTDEDGIGEVTLELGKWEVSVRDETLPDGYYLSGSVMNRQIVVNDESNPKPVPPFLIANGRVLEGSFDGVDLAELRADWIFVSIRDSKGEESEYRGKHDTQGNFRVTLPPDCKDGDIEKFEVCYIPVTNRRSLTVVSKSPWKLTWKPDIEKGE